MRQLNPRRGPVEEALANPPTLHYHPRMPSPPSTPEVFALLDHVLSSARLRIRKEAKPIAFDMLPEHETWMFDPRSDGALFSRKAAPEGAALLRVSCRPELLARMVTDPSFELREDDDASFEGNIEDLLLMVTALEDAGNAIGIRARKTP